MQPEDVMQILRQTGAARDGHFLLTSGLHSNLFLLCIQALQHPKYTEQLCRAMAAPYQNLGVQAVVGPALGGIVLAYEVARQLGARALFTEKTGQGDMALRRSQELNPGERILIVEDAITTGGSVRQCIAAVTPFQPTILGISVLVDRSAGRTFFGFPAHALLTLDVPQWDATQCPLCAAGEKLIQPKS